MACVISYFIPDIPHPILHPHGPQGAGKTSFFKIIKRICDPSSIEALITPRDLNQLIQVITHNHVCLFDNVSDIPVWMSDILSQACTGGGFSKRQLFTDDDDVVYQVKRCIGINGINLLIKKPDLMDRSILVYLDRIDPSQRKEENELWAEFDKIKPEILGGVFDALSKAMAIYPNVKLRCLPRMADFARWGYAITEALGKSGQDFIRAYQNNINQQNEEVIQGNTLAQAMLQLMSDKLLWSGTYKEAWTELDELASPNKSDTTFPKTERTLRKHLDRIKPNLIDQGISYILGARGEKGYKITFQKNPNFSSASSGYANQLSADMISAEDKVNKIDNYDFGSGLSSGDKCLIDNKKEPPVVNEPNLEPCWNNLKSGEL